MSDELLHHVLGLDSASGRAHQRARFEHLRRGTARETPAAMMRCSIWIAAVQPEDVALVAASLAILGFIIDRVVVPASRRLRRRREPKRLARALADLRCGVQLQRFTDLLGQPPTRSLGTRTCTSFDDVFVDVDTDDHSNVSRFAAYAA